MWRMLATRTSLVSGSSSQSATRNRKQSSSVLHSLLTATAHLNHNRNMQVLMLTKKFRSKIGTVLWIGIHRLPISIFRSRSGPEIYLADSVFWPPGSGSISQRVDPDQLVRSMDPRIQIRIHTKMSWIRNTACWEETKNSSEDVALKSNPVYARTSVGKLFYVYSLFAQLQGWIQAVLQLRDVYIGSYLQN